MGWCKIGERASPSEVGDYVLSQGKRGFRSEGPWMIEQSFSLQMVLAVCNRKGGFLE